MAEKIWYQVAADQVANTSERLADLKELGITGIYTDDDVPADFMENVKKAGLEFADSNAPVNEAATAAINQHVIERKISANDMVAELNHANFTNEQLLALAPSADNQTAYQAAAIAFLLPGQPVINAGLEGEKDSQDWHKVADLIKFRNDNAALFENGMQRVTVTENGLVKITRSEGKAIIGYFNTSLDALGFNSVAVLIQNYLVGQLLPKGVVIKQEAITE